MKSLFTATLMLALSACSSSGVIEEYAGEKGDQLLIQTGNYAALVKRYKEQVNKDPSPERRFKLANAIYLSGDPESAQFQLALIPINALKNADLEMLRANVLFDLDKLNSAEQHVNATLRLNDEYAEAYNLKGMLLAQRGELKQAKAAFQQARLNGFDDDVVKNNLAMIAMLQGDFDLAADILLPLVQNGRADSTVEANLLLALAKSGRSRAFSQLLGGQSQDTLRSKYISLNNVEANSHFSQTVPNVSNNTQSQQKAIAKIDAILSRVPAKSETKPTPTSKPEVLASTTDQQPLIEEKAPEIAVVKEAKETQELTNAKPPLSTDNNTEKTPIVTDPITLARQRVQAAKEAKAKQQLALKDAKEAKQKAKQAAKPAKKKRSRYLITDMRYQPTDGANEYVATSDFKLGHVRTEYLEKRKKWVFDIKGAKDFTTKRKRYLQTGPAKAIELGEHKNFVRIVLEMRENTTQKPDIQVDGNTLTIRWGA
ncbi:AMIN domain-containing protein [Enterovibrio sp. ZSDZ35]|uniref:AMIN domain-containing protein n=1 Tax=Enterovibrio qingdaonensis TaxID=2899818 RepID=A0ABT5QML9_9GAMM|nr:AMIN domain-containing protein [Enterovibrio sp. ZSDZ35]MDD1781725.1 AMIN domain-containing protein [Enterovibrio sp. ZSDZ35]